MPNTTIGAAIAAILLAAFTVTPGAGRSDPPDPKRVRILFIGNSYTYMNDLPRILQSIAAAENDSVTLDVSSIAQGGSSLRTHWNDRTIEVIRRGGFNYVVLQEQSTTPLEARDRLTRYGRCFANVVTAASARPVLYLTWSRRSRPAAQDSLNAAFSALARETGATIVPVGPAWSEFRRINPVDELYAEDGSHPSPLGSFVAASTFYRTMFGGLPSDASGRRHALSAGTVGFVRQAVEAAVTRFSAAEVRGRGTQIRTAYRCAA